MLSHFQAAPLLEARRAGELSARTSPDLGLSTVTVQLDPERISFPGGESLSWEELEAIAADKTACYQVRNGTAEVIEKFSENSGLYFALMPTESAPTMLISGIPMHRIKDTNPYQDTLSKIKAIAPLHGRVLDTATGLGYTAIQAAKTAEQVVTIEIDPVAQEIARFNPWSQELFENPRIRQIIGDSYEEIERFETGSFSTIIHDPPVFSLAGDLYSGAFYRQAFRVLKRGGRMFHYIGDPESKSGARTTRGVARRLQEAGFGRVVHKPRAFGVLAYKDR
ncbi:MAG TPA: methyltransferase [Anaerolineales bacterium]